MKLLADENFPPLLISHLQRRRHNIIRIQRSAKSISDISIREKAKRENRTVITFDRNFLDVKALVLVNTMFFDFPNVFPEEIVPYLDKIIKEISRLKKKKKPFIATYSKKGLKVILPT